MVITLLYILRTHTKMLMEDCNNNENLKMWTIKTYRIYNDSFIACDTILSIKNKEPMLQIAAEALRYI